MCTVAAHWCILQHLVCMSCHVSLCLDLFLTGKIKRLEWRSLSGRSIDRVVMNRASPTPSAPALMRSLERSLCSLCFFCGCMRLLHYLTSPHISSFISSHVTCPHMSMSSHVHLLCWCFERHFTPRCINTLAHCGAHSQVFPAVPYCIDLLGGAYLQGNPDKVKVFRSQSFSCLESRVWSLESFSRTYLVKVFVVCDSGGLSRCVWRVIVVRPASNMVFVVCYSRDTSYTHVFHMAAKRHARIWLRHLVAHLVVLAPVRNVPPSRMSSLACHSTLTSPHSFHPHITCLCLVVCAR